MPLRQQRSYLRKLAREEEVPQLNAEDFEDSDFDFGSDFDSEEEEEEDDDDDDIKEETGKKDKDVDELTEKAKSSLKV